LAPLSFSVRLECALGVAGADEAEELAVEANRTPCRTTGGVDERL